MRLKLHIKEDLTPLLKRVGLNMRSPQVSTIIQQGAELIAEEARRRAPVGPTGNLRAGIYTASTLRNNFRQLTRRGQRRVNEPLKYIRSGTVLVVSSTFYGRWVEKGRQSRSKYDVLRPGEKNDKTHRRSPVRHAQTWQTLLPPRHPRQKSRSGATYRPGAQPTDRKTPKPLIPTSLRGAMTLGRDGGQQTPEDERGQNHHHCQRDAAGKAFFP
jgi:hypothetical protein